MSHLTTTALPVGARPTRRRTTLRWLASFTGYPLGGLLALLLSGPVDDLAAALAGGLLTGGVLGAVQAWALGPGRVRPVTWVAATAAGMATGLAVGASLVGYGTDLGSLVAQGAVTGVAVGTAQAVVLLRRLGPVALAWPAYLGGVWAVGWAVTTSAGIAVGDQFTVFGSAGAVVATLLTAPLPLVLDRLATERSAS